jgi:hypothetical protein
VDRESSWPNERETGFLDLELIEFILGLYHFVIVDTLIVSIFSHVLSALGHKFDDLFMIVLKIIKICLLLPNVMP